MKPLTETRALNELQKLKIAFQTRVKIDYETKAKPCATCPTKGACCLDAHFVNVHITRLEAVAVKKTLEKLSEEKQREIYGRAADAIEKYDLNSAGDSFSKTFACPLYETGVGCLVHREAKPAPCIAHACYENATDLPPDDLPETIENQIERLNKRTYREDSKLRAIPVWLDLINPF